MRAASYFSGICIGFAAAGALTPLFGRMDGTAIVIFVLASLCFAVAAIPPR